MMCSFCCRTKLLREHVPLEQFVARGYAALDYPIFLELSRHTDFGYIDEALVRYRVAEGSYSHPRDPDRLFDFQRSIYAMKLDFAGAEGLSRRTADIVNRQYYTYLYRGGFRACRAEESAEGYAWLRGRYPAEYGGRTHLLRTALVVRPRLCRAVQRVRRLVIWAAARATRRSPAVLEAARANLPAVLAGGSAGPLRSLFLRSRSRSRFGPGNDDSPPRRSGP
jgi:hypothetical protein